MKTTVLVFVDETAPKKGLRIATMKEWNEILSNNRGLAMENRRIFYKDCIPEGDELDCMFIETTYAEFIKEEAERKARYRNEKERRKCYFISLAEQAGLQEDELCVEDIIASGCCLEDAAVENVMIEQLRTALARWNDWAPELLDIYMNGQGRSCTSYLMNKYGISERLVRKRKMMFREFVKNFYK